MSTPAMPATNGARPVTAESTHVRKWPLDAIRPSPENDKLYRPIDPQDPEIIALARSILEHGVREPLVITTDRYILSGHRRYAAARLAGLRVVPCRVENVSRADPQFMVLLREYNRQREKTFLKKAREEIVTADPEEAWRKVKEYRESKARPVAGCIQIRGVKRRSLISAAKQPFLKACLQILEANRAYWPLSDRQIHYRLLNDPPLKHASKPGSVYQNDKPSYKDLTDVLTRGRLQGIISMEAIADATRPVTIATQYQTARPFMRDHLNDMFKGYARNLQQSQPSHIEIVAEKLTVQNILRPLAEEYCIPLTIGRGYSSLPPRYEIVQRFQKSGKERLVILALSDFDPDGEEIAHSLARSLRDDFNVKKIDPLKIALTQQQVTDLDLPPILKAKESSMHYDRFTDQYGDNVFELEAVEPATLAKMLRDAIDSVLDVDAYNQEIEAEKQEAADLQRVRRQMIPTLLEMLQDSFMEFLLRGNLQFDPDEDEVIDTENPTEAEEDIRPLADQMAASPNGNGESTDTQAPDDSTLTPAQRYKLFLALGGAAKREE